MLYLSSQRRTGIKRISRAWAVQALMSGTVMVTLNIGMRLDFGLSGVDGSGMADAEIHRDVRPDYRSLPSLPLSRSDETPAPAAPVAALPGGEAGKTSRLDRPAFLAAQERVALASAGAAGPASATGVELASLKDEARREGVLLFDQCRPACESRDPLLPLNLGHDRRGDTVPSGDRVDPPSRRAASGPTSPAIKGETSVRADAPADPTGLIGTFSSRWSTKRLSTEAMLGTVTRLARW